MKIYLKHLSLLMFLLLLVFLTHAGVELFFSGIFFVYFTLFFFGIFSKGPLKIVGQAMIKDHEKELDEAQVKKPWE